MTPDTPKTPASPLEPTDEGQYWGAILAMKPYPETHAQARRTTTGRLLPRILGAIFVLLAVACGGLGGSGSIGLTKARQVAEAKAALAITYAPGDSASGVTRDVGLATTGLYDVQVSWISNQPGAISAAGLVTRPASGNAMVTLTATLTKGRCQDTKSFAVIVLSTSAAIATPEAVQASGGTQISGTAENAVIAGEGMTHTLATQPGASNRSGYYPPLP